VKRVQKRLGGHGVAKHHKPHPGKKPFRHHRKVKLYQLPA
jgi:hypothetical protein